MSSTIAVVEDERQKYNATSPEREQKKNISLLVHICMGIMYTFNICEDTITYFFGGKLSQVRRTTILPQLRVLCILMAHWQLLWIYRTHSQLSLSLRPTLSSAWKKSTLQSDNIVLGKIYIIIFL